MGFIKAVVPMKDHRLLVEMESGSSMIVDMSVKLRSMRYKALADESLFNNAKLDRDWDCVVWGNGLTRPWNWKINLLSATTAAGFGKRIRPAI